LRLLNTLNRQHLAARAPVIHAWMPGFASYSLAAPHAVERSLKVLDIAGETEATRAAFMAWTKPATEDFGPQLPHLPADCLERGRPLRAGLEAGADNGFPRRKLGLARGHRPADPRHPWPPRAWNPSGQPRLLKT